MSSYYTSSHYYCSYYMYYMCCNLYTLGSYYYMYMYCTCTCSIASLYVLCYNTYMELTLTNSILDMIFSVHAEFSQLPREYFNEYTGFAYSNPAFVNYMNSNYGVRFNFDYAKHPAIQGLVITDPSKYLLLLLKHGSYRCLS